MFTVKMVFQLILTFVFSWYLLHGKSAENNYSKVIRISWKPFPMRVPDWTYLTRNMKNIYAQFIIQGGHLTDANWGMPAEGCHLREPPERATLGMPPEGFHPRDATWHLRDATCGTAPDWATWGIQPKGMPPERCHLRYATWDMPPEFRHVKDITNKDNINVHKLMIVSIFENAAYSCWVIFASSIYVSIICLCVYHKYVLWYYIKNIDNVSYAFSLLL